MDNKPVVSVRRTAQEVKRYRTIKRIVPIIIAIIATVLLIVFVLTIFYNRYGSFTVTINKLDASQYGLTLSQTKYFDEPLSQIAYDPVHNVTNIDGKTLPDNLDEIDGEHNGKNYAAYTFYCKNTGSKTVVFQHELYIANMTNGVENAIRVKVYVNGVPTVYAEPKEDITPEVDTVPFLTPRTIMKGEIENFKPEQVVKYTVVIWLEGNDDECVDSIIGGQFKIAMKMSVLGESAEQAD